MHRDTKIGLAMAIVLIGLAAALCFPRESMQELAALQLPEADELDARIEELPVRAYTAAEQGVSPEIPNPQPLAGTVKPQQPAFRPSDIVDAVLGRRTSPPASAPAPIPAAPAAPPTAELPKPKPDLYSARPSPLLVEAPSALAQQEPQVAGQLRTHIVQPGDTLSGIALQHLGSVARYPEIFEANRDILDSPDALRLGMQLRIPGF
jgi:nucleoid-associated protein YgaU